MAPNNVSGGGGGGERPPARSKVEHNYVDHAHETDTGYLEDSDGKPIAHASDRNFPVKLHYMLSELEEDGQDHIVSWAPHGRCFVVHDQVSFCFSRGAGYGGGEGIVSMMSLTPPAPPNLTVKHTHTHTQEEFVRSILPM